MDLWGPHRHQYAGPSVWRGSESMCGAVRGLDGHWTVNLWALTI